MAAKAHRARRRAAAWGLVLGLTPSLASAAPPDPVTEPAPESVTEAEPEPTDPPSAAPTTARVELSSTAVAIELVAIPLGADGQPSGTPVELGAPPVSATLPVGRWRLEARGRGYQPHAQELALAPGDELRVAVEPTLIDGALLELRSANQASEGAQVVLDGVALCRVPCSEMIEPGRHIIEIDKPRHKPLRAELDAVQADEIVFEVALERATSRAPALVTGTVALASLTTAVVFTVRSAQARRSLAADLEAGVQYDQDDRRIDNGRRDAIIASAMYGVTGVVGALTLYYLLRQAGPSSRANKQRRSLAGPVWQLGPSFGRREAALVLTVRF